jgi:hypothetical protein
MTTYKLQKSYNGQINHVIKNDTWTIPFDPANTDYQTYLKWISEGNQPEPADE